MPDPDRLLTTLRRAAAACRTTPGRQGRIIHLPPGAELLVAGDLHGNIDNFRRLLLLSELVDRPQRHLLLQEVIHGPFRYPDGADKSHQLLDLVAALKAQFPDRVHFLPGNHELAQAAGRPVGKGDCNDILNALFQDGVRTAYGARAEEVYIGYLDLFAAAPLAVRTASRVLACHSLPSASHLATFDPAVLTLDETPAAELEPGGSVFSLVWGRDTRPDHVAAFLKIMDADLLITGHIPCDEGFEFPGDRHLIVDSASVPGACCLVPAGERVSLDDLRAGVCLLVS